MKQFLLKHKFSLLLVAAISFAGCSSKCIEDSGNHIVRDITVSPFDEIEIDGPVKLVLRQDSSFKLAVSADSSIIDKIKTTVSGEKFKVSLDPMQYCGGDSIVIHAGIGALTEIKAAGASKVYSEGSLHVGDIDMKLSGATELNLNLYAGKVKTESDGAARLTLSGQAGAHELDSKGVLELNAFDFVVAQYDIDIQGTGKSNINVLNDLKVKTSGSSTIYYKGNPKNVSDKKSGTSKLEKVN
ncbi:head GIN domain-containing protein [Pedobacter sp. SAFR-022]|uniref:head GIN domain-containing protein n=1 Tax=Pedobacter sp. SAFR-022 TaxID=3436861 RepID=UPI003F801E2D